MLFTSGLFLFAFLPAALILFFLLARAAGPGIAAGWLAMASLFFYGYWMPAYLWLLVGSILLNYAGGILITRAGRHAGRVTALFVTTNLLLLAFFKYYNFFSDNLRAVAVPAPVLDIVLPIGISFFTFTQIAYLVDTWKGKVRDTRLVHYTLFVTYFPHLISGPILHHAEMMPQFAERSTYRPQLDNFALGSAFLLCGLVKKVLVADSISGIADRAFAAAGAGQIGPLHAWEGAIAYAFQIYFDFSGYSDMAVGISLLFNIQLPYNFASPYRSTSIVEFWRRWHMTLSRFLRDYLYIGLGGNRHGSVRRYLNLGVTMVLGGLWHGAAWTFVIWGALHGVYLMLNHGWNALTRGRVRGPVARASGWLVTMLAVLVAWVFFRATDVDMAMSMLRGMAGATPIIDPLAHTGTNWTIFAALTLFAIALPNSQSVIMERLKPSIAAAASRHPALLCYALGAVLALVVWLAFVAASRTNSAFIYFNF